MKTSQVRRVFLNCLLLALGVAAGRSQVISPEEALNRLLSGNQRYVVGNSGEKRYVSERPALVEGQHPYAIILTCADSRVVPEAIFDESLGRLFVIRVAGNVSDPIILGSIEYAVEHLHASLLLVMGHESCGAVKAALSNSAVPPNIARIIQRIQPAVDKVRVQIREEDKLLDAAVRENSRLQARMVTFESDVLNDMVKERKLTIVAGVYSLHTGKVEILDRATKEAKSEDYADRPPAFALETLPQAAVQDSKPGSFSEKLRTAYSSNAAVLLKANVLMRDSHDRCLTGECKRLMAGNVVTIDSPYVVETVGRPSIRVRNGRQVFFMQADPDAFDFDSADGVLRENGMLVRVLSAPGRIANAVAAAASVRK